MKLHYCTQNMANKMFFSLPMWLVVIVIIINFQSNVILTKALENTVTDKQDDYDRQHPVNVSVTGTTYTSLNVSWTIPPHENSTDITGYEVWYHKFHDIHAEDYHMYKSVGPNVTSFTLVDLEPGTQYSFIIKALYSTGHNPKSRYVTKLTDGYGPDRRCECDPLGTNKTEKTQQLLDCNFKTGQCPCNTNAIGRKCDSCENGYFKHPVIGCQKCSCDGENAKGTCHIAEGSIPMCDCKNNFAGKYCKSCADGFYLDKKGCTPCQCNKNSNQCHVHTGECIGCKFNTTGKHCESCKEGYTGDAISSKNCTKHEDVFSSGMNSHTAIVIGVVGAILGIVLIVLGVLFYRHWKRWSKKPLQFWTVELRDDHENVNFSGMMEQPEFLQPESTVMNQERDKEVQYFEKDRGNRSSKRAGNSVYRSLTT